MGFEEIRAGLECSCKGAEEKPEKTQVVMPRQYQKFNTLEAMNCYRQNCLMRVKGVYTLPFFCNSRTCPVRMSQAMTISITSTTPVDVF